MLSSPVYPLSNPKGVKLECEMCQKTAHVMCSQCRVTYYCDVAHQEADWNGIHEKICQLLIPIRTAPAFLSSAKERKHNEEQMIQRQKHLINLTRTVAQKLLFEGKHEEAIPGALQSLRFANAVYGNTSAELVPSQLLLAEASIGLGQLDEAENYLSQAHWTVMRTTECVTAIQYKLYRNLGLLYTAKCNNEKALWYFADDIYHATQVFSASDIRTAGGYFHMANVFYRMKKMDIADSLYSETMPRKQKQFKFCMQFLTCGTKNTFQNKAKLERLPRPWLCFISFSWILKRLLNMQNWLWRTASCFHTTRKRLTASCVFLRWLKRHCHILEERDHPPMHGLIHAKHC
ncbi:zinc finger MYND domain-containing protein 12 isoform X2 [Stegostoma tigrinum]|uniref:zinc finger MYND domain-containing protein 12 isoform X2 n=1 Tax=Stegostoma tigrinum TaxID=3053191 RepID=UPI00202B65DA|nr:zinc finger MYND domain-containing protein 12 isoform X2 [Stegostoma tigrinum]